MELADFLLARIAEDEYRAQQADPWATGSRDEGQPVDWRVHMHHWSPACVLAECDAKRRIVEWFPERTVLRLLTLPYADHPDYREEWRP